MIVMVFDFNMDPDTIDAMPVSRLFWWLAEKISLDKFRKNKGA